MKSTKQKILDVALDLFSIKGYEATSIKEIADNVGIAKASLYSHYQSKEEILNALIKETLDNYDKHSIFAKPNYEMFISDDLSVEKITAEILKHVQYILHTPYIMKARKMLMIEQFRSVELANLLTKQNYDDVLNYFEALIKYLVAKKMLVAGDEKIMACQLCLPITVWINLSDRDSSREDEVIDLITKHVQTFFEQYKVK